MIASSGVDAFLKDALAKLTRDPRVRYAEVRFTNEDVESIRLRASTRGRADHVGTSRSRGVGIRVLGAKTWGFASTASLDEASIMAAVERAIRLADASSRITAKAAPFPLGEARRGSYATKLAVDPKTITIEEKIATLDGPLRAMLRGDTEVKSAEARMEWRMLEKRLLTTEGTDVTQSFVIGACGMRAVAVSDTGDAETRSYPTWEGCDGFQGGWERIGALDLAGNAERVRDEAIALLRAPRCPSGEYDLILESSQVALQIHESCGHPTELDRALGTEITLAGGSFLQPSMMGSFRYGSDIVTLTADSVAEGGLGTFSWDDEGTPAGTHVLVDRGVFTDWLSSRETAAGIGRASTGTMRASGWDRTPLIRMTNVSLAPREGSLEDLVADTKRGILMATDKSWSIDDQRLDFHFACEIGWEIENGKRTRMVKNPMYGGSTPAFWGSCDAVCGPEEWRLWGINTCGKGEPMQAIGVGHGAAPARFRRVKVGGGS
jgi:TldD protein